MTEPKYAAGLWVYADTVDRFAPGGYKGERTLADMIRMAGETKGLQGIECHQIDFDSMSVDEYKKMTGDLGLVTTNVNTNVWSDPKFALNAFAHRDPKLRGEAIGEGKKSVDLARKLGSPCVGLWLGSDGHDYCFQIDYGEQWDLLVDAIAQVAEYAKPDTRVAIEYKLKEPRMHMTIGTVGKALMICDELGMDHVGVAVDFGHALMAKETPGETVAILHRKKKLFNVHFNDAYREWDDDMIAGSVHFWETLEFLYYCKKTGYDGWFGLDMFPFREDSVRAAELSIENVKAMWEMLDRIDMPALKAAQSAQDAPAAHQAVRQVVFG
jgi:L-rhamnose isomerase